jgi:hypothetical protein
MNCGFFLELLPDAHQGQDRVAQITVSYFFGTNSSQDNRVLEIAQFDILNIKTIKENSNYINKFTGQTIVKE